ncbi:citryl-CoA lyase [Pelagibacterium xiamenense]|uniref:citryl-CoA lyase n=1 Tax=Pelagibacterium xiamenense TaxID=2901140 RepID=UPI001E4D68A8|nr:citryl-CoA lyase [Pelagibacterium xiamenense]MCD7059573.1 citryl-CoA lyase [Pelagibacterium xiamenense]
MPDTDRSAKQAMMDWWQTDIIEMEPGIIRFWGYPIEELIGSANFAQMIWLMTRGELPTREQAQLLDAALVAGVDHGPQAPSIAISRMASTCGVGLNNAMASAMNVLGDVHGGAGEQAVELYCAIAARIDGGQDLDAAVADGIDTFIEEHGKYLPGFGHRFHPVDPRAPRLMALVRDAASHGVVGGGFVSIAESIEATLTERKGRPIPMNIDGATAVIYAELGFPAPLARGLFCISRNVGIMAHAWEQMQQGGRNKGPLPRQYLWSYTGKAKRSVPSSSG